MTIMRTALSVHHRLHSLRRRWLAAHECTPRPGALRRGPPTSSGRQAPHCSAAELAACHGVAASRCGQVTRAKQRSRTRACATHGSRCVNGSGALGIRRWAPWFSDAHSSWVASRAPTRARVASRHFSASCHASSDTRMNGGGHPEDHSTSIPRDRRAASSGSAACAM